LTQGTPSSGTVVVGIDGSPGSLCALDWAADAAASSGSELRILMAWQWPASLMVAGLGGTFDPSANARECLERAALRAAKRHPGLVVASEVMEGHPAPLLVERAADADLLVVGSHGRGAFADTIVGSVSRHCARHARCPVAVIPPPHG
jgi:nucleotide-binding universal stress UspA family protein